MRWGRVRLYQSTHLAVAVAGVGASLPGAVAPYEFAFVGLVEGFGGGSLSIFLCMGVRGRG